ncbi:hypothetical protein [Halogranum rubrum]|nr:hypothetical protein [Halogranum salarium]
MNLSRENGHIATTAVTSEEAFQAALRRLVIAADSNGVDVRGGWPVFIDSEETIGWEAEIHEFARLSSE